LPRYSLLFDYTAATAQEWLTILKLAHMWDCDNVRDLAFCELDRMDYEPLKRVLLARDYDAPQKWMDKAIQALANRPAFLSEEEGHELGISLIITITRLRERNKISLGWRERSRSHIPPWIQPQGIIIPPPWTQPPPIIIPPPRRSPSRRSLSSRAGSRSRSPISS